MDFENRVATTKKTLEGVYKPTLDFYNKQLGGLQAEYDPMRTAADQARVNSFKKIENTANARGMFFSGMPIQNQMEYNYGTYQPAMANIDIAQKNKKNSLQETLLKIGTEIDSSARKTVADQMAEEEKARQKEIDRQIAEKRHQENLAASYARTSSSNNSKELAKYKVTNKSGGGKAFTYAGTPISLAQYVAGTGGDVNTVLDFLRWGTSYSQNIYNQVKGMKNPNDIMNTIRVYDKNNYYGFGNYTPLGTSVANKIKMPF